MKTDPKSKSSLGRIGGLLLGALTIFILGSIAAYLVLPNGQQSANAEPAIPPGVSLTSWFDNGKGGEHVMQIASGDAPPVGVRFVGTVKTDTDCDPDAQGLNHCHNVIDLGNGRSIEVIHNHMMHRYPCLSPGQRLSITRLNTNWLIANEGQVPRVN
ncbi:MAG: hypothetical protein JJE34_05775 [Alphaproteobacteria bacterium]|nr:hypothetical protein [Alphaproteobacteria bacterium]